VTSPTSPAGACSPQIEAECDEEDPQAMWETALAKYNDDSTHCVDVTPAGSKQGAGQSVNSVLRDAERWIRSSAAVAPSPGPLSANPARARAQAAWAAARAVVAAFCRAWRWLSWAAADGTMDEMRDAADAGQRPSLGAVFVARLQPAVAAVQRRCPPCAARWS